MSEDEIAAKREVFLIFDKQGDSKIDSSDIGLVIRAMDKNPLESEVARIVSELDPQGDRRVTFAELLPYLSRPSINTPGSAAEFIDGLRVFDKDGSGFMSAADLRHVLTAIGEKMTDKQVDQLLSNIEMDKEGNVNYEELVRAVCSG